MRSDKTPRAVIDSLIAALRDRDLNTLVELYEEAATLVVYTGMQVKGTLAIRQFFVNFFATDSEPFHHEAKTLIESGDLALYTALWINSGSVYPDLPVPGTLSQAIVLRKQPDGNWRIAIDNPHAALPPQKERRAVTHPRS